MAPEIKYAQSGDVAIAYMTIGSGPVDIVYAPGSISHLEHELAEPRWAGFIRDLSRMARVIKFDKRGTGLSDRVNSPNMDQRIDDIRAVMDAAGSERAILLGISEGGSMCALFAATYPHRVSKLILMASFADRKQAIPSNSRQWIPTAEELRAAWGTGASLSLYSTELPKDPAFLEWWQKFERLSASPNALIELRRYNAEIDVKAILPSIQAPTLVVHGIGDFRISVEASRDMVRRIPDAKLVEIDSDNHLIWLDQTGAVISAIQSFVGLPDAPAIEDRVLATVLFTDIVDSTRQAVDLGDAEWRRKLQAHDSVVEYEIGKLQGRRIKSLGDGVLATFETPGRAVKCALSIISRVASIGLAVRAGLHTGELNVARDGDVSGIAVHIASRVNHQASANEVWTTRTVKDLVAGSGLRFIDRGSNALKGLDEPLRLYQAVEQDQSKQI